MDMSMINIINTLPESSIITANDCNVIKVITKGNFKCTALEFFREDYKATLFYDEHMKPMYFSLRTDTINTILRREDLNFENEFYKLEHEVMLFILHMRKFIMLHIPEEPCI